MRYKHSIYIVIFITFLIIVYGSAGLSWSRYESAQFMLEGEKEVFLYAIPDGSSDGAKKALQGTGFDELNSSNVFIQNSGFIDAEKEKGEKQMFLCWAACASNMLQYSGWGSKAVDPLTGSCFVSEDELFEYFAASFSGGRGNVAQALRWFSDGHYSLKTNDKEVASLLAGADTKGLLSSVYQKSFLKEYDLWENPDYLRDILDGMKNKNAVSLEIRFVQRYSGKETVRHSITVFGYIIDRQSDAVEMLIVADSDDSVTEEGEKAENRYRIVAVSKENIAGKEKYFLNHYGMSSSNAEIHSAYVLTEL